jgi:GNAT superfamily N-acetyltransferase
MNIDSIEKTLRAIKFFVNEEGKEVGRASLYLISNDLHAEPYGLLEDVYVEESHRGRGLATELVNAIIARAKEEGCYKLIGQSRYAREDVHRMYEKVGFKDHGKNFRMDFAHAS